MTDDSLRWKFLKTLKISFSDNVTKILIEKVAHPGQEI